MTAQHQFYAKLGLLGFVTFFVIFFSQPRGQYAAPALGETVPNFTLRDDDGKVVALGEFRSQIVPRTGWGREVLFSECLQWTLQVGEPLPCGGQEGGE